MDIRVTFDDVTLTGDLAVVAGLLALEPGPKSSIIISLFSDARAGAADELPDDETSRRGYWADALSDDPEESTGSLLWLLQREKQTEKTRLRAKAYAERSLQWMIRDGVARAITVVAEWIGQGRLGLGIAVSRPDGTTERYRFEQIWQAAEAE
ncbi:phage GP46 family protein [Ferrovibrio terrae]|uniref:phage GP46 family protein n=1 Tax=Ferrovibrio terrae TaxID=2594003 RepID=UPI003137BA92